MSEFILHLRPWRVFVWQFLQAEVRGRVFKGLRRRSAAALTQTPFVWVCGTKASSSDEPLVWKSVPPRGRHTQRSRGFAADFHVTSPAQGELCEMFPRILAENKLLPTSEPVLNMLRPACVLIQSRSGCKFYTPVPEMAAIISLCCLKPFMWGKSPTALFSPPQPFYIHFYKHVGRTADLSLFTMLLWRWLTYCLNGIPGGRDRRCRFLRSLVAPRHAGNCSPYEGLYKPHELVCSCEISALHFCSFQVLLNGKDRSRQHKIAAYALHAQASDGSCMWVCRPITMR